MEGQPDHPADHQHTTADLGFRSFQPLLPALAIMSQVQQHPGCSSVNAASLQASMPPTRMPIILPSHLDPAHDDDDDDGYCWRNVGQQEILGGSSRIISYECAQAGCVVKKSVVLPTDGQIELLYRGRHNHPRPHQELWPRDGHGPAHHGYAAQPPPEVSAAGTSMAGMEEGGGEQLPSSSDTSDEDDGVEARADEGDAARDRDADATHQTHRFEWSNVSNGLLRERRSKSTVWEGFNRVSSDGKTQRAECKRCKRYLSGNSSAGTSHLHRHLKKCRAQSTEVRVQQHRASAHLNSLVENNPKFDQEKSLELITKALVSNLCAFSLTSDMYFRQFLAGICPTYDMVSHNAVGKKFLRIFHDEKLKLKEKIALAPTGVLLAATIWRSEYESFICVTVHFVDKEWRINRKILRCTYLGNEDRECHEDDICMFSDWQSYLKWYKEAAKGIIKEVMQDWSLEQKLLGIASSNGLLGDVDTLGLQENLTAQNYLLARYKLLTLPCMVDTLNCILRFSPNKFVTDISRDWFKYMTCSPLRREKYEEIVSQLHLNRPSFGTQKRHWTYFLLEAVLQFNKALPNPEQMDSQQYPSKPSYEKLEAAENFCNLVRPIYHALEVFSSPCNATLNLYFHAIWNWKIALLSSSIKANINKVYDVQHMQKEFDKLWRRWYLWLSLAVVLDPRYKFSFLKFRFNQAFGSDAKTYILGVRAKMYELFVQYSCYADQPIGDYIEHEQSAHENLVELIGYLEGELIPQDIHLDILKWWKDNASVYPTLARLACDILVIPASAVSAESTFQEYDERVYLFKRKMNPEVVEALICTQDWIKSTEIRDEDGGDRNAPAA
ncbi:hypothetical protein ACP4OV_026853 [Aristida adscensionis]